MKAKDIIGRIGKGLKDAAPTIGITAAVVVITGAYVYACEKLGIEPSSSPTYIHRTDYTNSRPTNMITPMMFMMPRNSTESKILALAEDATHYQFDSDRIRMARAIRDIAVENEDDDVKQVAIMALQDISKKMMFDSDRSRVMGYVKEI